MRRPCDCEHIHPAVGESETTELGIDRRNGRSGRVTVHRCPACGAPWLHYLVEYEAFSGSGRWFCGRVDDTVVAALSAETAVGTLSGLEWYWAGGSYFGGDVSKGSGAVPVDLYGPPAIE